jgi:hypothetical protein
LSHEGIVTEIYISTDIEADGPIPGPHSMLSIGAAAFREDKTMLSPFSANLELLPGAVGDVKTMEWWTSQPQAWEATRRNARPPTAVMVDYVQWI